MSEVIDRTAALERAGALADGRRRLLGITGPPGAGKTTLAEQLVAGLGERAVLVPMDGFHLADVQLERLGLAGCKGAPDTFDADGYLAVLDRVRHAVRTVYVPGFERTLEQPIAASIGVRPDVPLVITEGNYLLLEDEPWAQVRTLLDEVWWVDSDPDVRHERLIERHVRFGKAPDAAATYVNNVDEANARAVEPGRRHADVIIDAAREESGWER